MELPISGRNQAERDAEGVIAPMENLQDAIALLGGHRAKESQQSILEEHQQASMRRQLVAIQNDTSMDAVTKARRMQELMSEQWKRTQTVPTDHNAPSESLQRQPTYHVRVWLLI